MGRVAWISRPMLCPPYAKARVAMADMMPNTLGHDGAGAGAAVGRRPCQACRATQAIDYKNIKYRRNWSARKIAYGILVYGITYHF